jgi:hypothetical protein
MVAADEDADSEQSDTCCGDDEAEDEKPAKILRSRVCLQLILRRRQYCRPGKQRCRYREAIPYRDCAGWCA